MPFVIFSHSSFAMLWIEDVEGALCSQAPYPEQKVVAEFENNKSHSLEMHSCRWPWGFIVLSLIVMLCD